MYTRLLIFILSSVAFTSAWSQNTQKFESVYADYHRAEDLYEKSQFAASRIEYERFLAQKLDKNDPIVLMATYHRGMAALHLYHSDAIALLDDFNRTYPENTYKNIIYFEIGNSYFENEDYENANLSFDKVDVNALDSIEKESVNFKMGYGYYQGGSNEKALQHFQNVTYSINPYGPIALYYASHLRYLKGALQTAKEGFHLLKSKAEYAEIAPYYIVQINHKQGLYDSVIVYANALLQVDTLEYSNYQDIVHLLGDSYYQTGDYENAAKYLSQYDEKSNTTRMDDYQLGFSFMMSKKNEAAIAYLDKVARIDDSLGQTAMYQIGTCYSSLGKPVPARNAFEKASRMKSLPNVSEDALYQFAVISFDIDINPYDESVRAFEHYLSMYPNSKRKQDIFQYLVNVYASTSNYAKALESLNKLANKDAQLKRVYQTVAYNFGVELFQKSELDSALNAFGLVDKYDLEPELMAKAKFWKAELYYRKGLYKNAITAYKTFLSSPSANLLEEKSEAYYNIGYAYLQLDQATDALEYFGIYLQSNPLNKEKSLDAMFQLADGNYAQGKDELAIQYYKQILQLNSALSDRATYYLAKSYGYNKQPSLKINTLEGLLKKYTRSKYLQNASFELAMSYKSQSEFEKAFQLFENFVSTYPKSPKILNCRIEIADLYYKQWNYVKAESAYRGILLEFSNKNDICALAAKGLMDVYVAMKSPEKAEAVANEYACADLSSDEKENLYYNPALQSYVDSNYQDAIPKFKQYINKFPEGRFFQDANFYLGNSFLKTKDTVQAIQYYETYVSGPVSLYFEGVYYRISTYYYDHKQFEKALEYYQKLDQIAEKPTNQFAAKLGLMRCSFLLKNHVNAKTHALQVKNNPALTQPLRIEAEYVLGMSSYYVKSYDDAGPSLRWLVKNTTTVRASEAKYALADIKYAQMEMDSALTHIKQLLKMKPSYNYWVAKSLILQTKIQIDQQNYVEAEQTISSVIDFYPTKETDGILVEAKALAEQIKVLQNPTKKVVDEPQKTIEIKPE
ncbi:MAG: outer membrane protein assembly factor BamD [Flavobacteriia bacterium]|nr:outer membrane protein assembly factor BamD [Flavobacteriia bacterium]